MHDKHDKARNKQSSWNGPHHEIRVMAELQVEGGSEPGAASEPRSTFSVPGPLAGSRLGTCTPKAPKNE